MEATAIRAAESGGNVGEIHILRLQLTVLVAGWYGLLGEMSKRHTYETIRHDALYLILGDLIASLVKKTNNPFASRMRHH